MEQSPIAEKVRYWPSFYGRGFCALFGWVGHAWVPVIRGFDGGEMVAGRQCRRCWRSEDCPCHRCAQYDGSSDGAQ